MRRGEIVNLHWTDVDLPRHFVHVQSNPTFRTKAGKGRTVPLNDASYHLLMLRVNTSPCEYVFSLNDRKVMANWVTHKLNGYIRRLDLDDSLNFHSLRHSFASWLAMNGVSIYQISKLLGHSDVKTTQSFYAHLEMSTLRETVNKIKVDTN
jgi:integrase